MQRTRVIPPLFLAIGIGALSLAVYSYANTRQLVAQGEHAQGVVVALSRSRSVYSPVVAFKTADGTEVEFVGQVGTSSPRFLKGQSLDVIYRRENPGRENQHVYGSLGPSRVRDTFGHDIFRYRFCVHLHSMEDGAYGSRLARSRHANIG